MGRRHSPSEVTLIPGTSLYTALLIESWSCRLGSAGITCKMQICLDSDYAAQVCGNYARCLFLKCKNTFVLDPRGPLVVQVVLPLVDPPVRPQPFLFLLLLLFLLRLLFLLLLFLLLLFFLLLLLSCQSWSPLSPWWASPVAPVVHVDVKGYWRNTLQGCSGKIFIASGHERTKLSTTTSYNQRF